MEAALSKLESDKKSEYAPYCKLHQLVSIPRKIKRDEIGVPEVLPFVGHDTWNHYEVSWLNRRGKPQIMIAEIIFGCNSPNVIESNSMRLYFNSLNNMRFEHVDQVRNILIKDISACVGTHVFVELIPLAFYQTQFSEAIAGVSIDDIDTECACYTVAPDFLFTEAGYVEEALQSDLFRSNCSITDEPDWGSVKIFYKGKKINREGLLKYIISFRNYDAFLEQCIERIFLDIQKRCAPEKLTVYGRFTRRGGLDINPVRSNHPLLFENMRDVRQ